MVELIPPQELAIQWDLAVENRLVDTALAREGAAAAEALAARLAAPAADITPAIAQEVALGYHGCFGTLSGWPSRQPSRSRRHRHTAERGGDWGLRAPRRFLASADARQRGRRVFRAARTTAGAGREGLSRRHSPYAQCRRPAPSAASGAAASRGIRPRGAVRLWSRAGAAGPPADRGRQCTALRHSRHHCARPPQCSRAAP